MLDHVVLAADHHAVAALQAPHAAADTDVDVMQLLGRELLRAAQVVVIVGVAAVDDDVAGREQRHQLGEHRVDRPGRDHHPNRARLRQTVDEGF
jgi:hypothetical protein